MYLLIIVRGSVPSKSNSYRIVRRTGGGARLIKDDAVIAFEQAVTLAARSVFSQLGSNGSMFPAPQPVEVILVWHRKIHDHRRRDLDNIHKAVADALTDANAWDDDRQVTTYHTTVRFDANEEGDEWLDIMLSPDAADPRPVPRSRSKRRTI